ncbi:hypothetical protein ADUPG1_006017, partial [Aduncisulcus paluster]
GLSAEGLPPRSASAIYRLRALVTHRGPSANSGHYVAHVLKKIAGEEKWIIYNDVKVGIAAEVPVPLAYMYFYELVEEE